MKKIKYAIKNIPWLIALIYIAIGLFWISFSDQWVLSLFNDPDTITSVQSQKGYFFVIFSGLLIFFLVRLSNNILGNVIEDLSKSNQKFKDTFENAPVGIAHHKPDEKWIEVNQTLCNLLGYSREELMQLNFSDFIHSEDLEKGRQLDQKINSGKIENYHIEKRYIKKDGTTFTGLLHKSAVFNKEQKTEYIVVVLEDISHQKEQEKQILQSLKEKEILLSEIHHRVRNNLALISAFFDLENMHSDDEYVHQILLKNITRVKCLALIHETFSENNNTAAISLNTLLNQLADYLISTVFDEGNMPVIRKNISPVILNINIAIPVSLIVTELIISSKKESKKSLHRSFLELSLSEESGIITITISDDGNGIVTNSSINHPNSLSSIIIQTLISQVEGKMETNTSEIGTSFILSFKNREIRGAGSTMALENQHGK